MKDMHNPKRNKWVVSERPSATKGTFRDGSREEAGEYEERLMSAKPDHIGYAEDMPHNRN